MGRFLNAKRLRDYPRLFFFTTWTMLLLNWVFHQGWLGAVGQIIGNDFLVFYSAGLLFRTDPGALYDPMKLNAIQNLLIEPTQLGGLIPYTNPPYAAPVYSLLTYLPYGAAFAVWTVIAIACLGFSAYWLVRYLMPDGLRQMGLSSWQMFFLVGGYFGFVEGLQVGQNHAITLLLVSVMVVQTVRKRPWMAGAAAGLLLYKPHFVLGFLILWLVWREWRALIGFGITGLVWVGTSLLIQGIDPYVTYIGLAPKLIQLYELKGLGSFLEVTLYGFLVSIFGQNHWAFISVINQIAAVLAGIGIGIYGWKIGNANTVRQQAPAFMLAILFPLIFSPHVLLHDSILLAIVFLLWRWVDQTTGLLYVIILVILGAFSLPWFAFMLEISFLGLIPVWLGIRLVRQLIKKQFAIPIPIQP